MKLRPRKYIFFLFLLLAGLFLVVDEVQANDLTLTLLSPNGGECLEVGSTYTVSWNYTGTADHFEMRIFYYKGDFAEEHLIWKFDNISGTSYNWLVQEAPSYYSNKLKIRITVHGSGHQIGLWDYSDSYFSINNDSSDCVSPSISNVSVANLSHGSTTIIWVTNETSDSTVEYGFNKDNYIAMVTKEALVTNHSVTIGTGADALYHYRVMSRDAAGNPAISEDYTFTAFGPPPDTDFQISFPTNLRSEATSSAAIRWYFKDDYTTEVGFELFEKMNGHYRKISTLTSAKSWDSNIERFIEESGLDPNTKYQNRFVRAYKSTIHTQFSPEFPARYTLISTPANITLSNQANSSLTLVVNDTFPNLANNQSGLFFENITSGANSSWVQEKSYTFSNLTPGTTYIFRVKARNGDGIETDYSSNVSFSTLAKEEELPRGGKKEVPITAPLYPDGTLLRAKNTNPVYLIEKGTKHHLPSPEVFNSYGYSWKDIVEVESSELESYQDIILIRELGKTRVYKLENKIKRWIIDSETFDSLGYDWRKIIEVNNTEVESYTTGDPISTSVATKTVSAPIPSSSLLSRLWVNISSFLAAIFSPLSFIFDLFRSVFR